MIINDQKIRQEMIYLLGQLEAACYPLVGININNAYYDLIDSIREQYVKILKQIIGYEE
jgi:hypothetical protein